MSARRFRRTAVVAAAATTAALLAAGTNLATAGAAPLAPTSAAVATGTGLAADGSVAAAAAPKRVKLRGPKNFATGGKIRIKGRVATKGRRPVRLQEKKGKRWVGRGKTRTNGTFTFRVNAGKKVRNRTFRVVVPKHKGQVKSQAKRKVRVKLATRMNVKYTTKKPRLGKAAKVSGRIKGKGRAKRKVVLQLKHRDGWKQLAKARTNKKGRFSTRVPAGWLYKGKVRVKAPGNKRIMPGRAGATKMKVRPTWTPGGAGSSWTYLQGTTLSRFRWNPCSSKISYRINLARSPHSRKQTIKLVKQSVRQIAKGTGLRFRYLGTTNGIYAPAAGYPGHPADTRMLISWALEHETSYSFEGGRVLAWGGGRAWMARDARGTVGEFATGGVVIDASRRTSTSQYTKRILMHEIGHAVGLGHAETDQAQIMFPSIIPNRANNWGKGDINGLHNVGRQSGCVRKVSGRGNAELVKFAMP